MHGTSFPFPKRRTIVTNNFVTSVVSALYCFYVRVSNKFVFLRKPPFTRETLYIVATAMEAMFSKTTERHVETGYVQCYILFECLCVYCG